MGIKAGMDKIVMFGAGDQAVLDYYILREHYDIAYVLDNDEAKQLFYGKRVELPDESNVRQYFIVVCMNGENYLEVAEQLKSYGLKELRDFCPSGAMGKKIVLLHGNCHVRVLKQYMISSELFRSQYYIYPTPPVQCFGGGYIDEDVLGGCDVFIHQDIRKDNPYGEQVSDEYTVSRLNSKCKNITIPNLYRNFGKAFFPQEAWNKSNRQNRNIAKGMFPYGDANVAKLVEQGIRDRDEIIGFLKGHVYSKEFIQERFEFYKEAILERQKNWDIKIMDYILNNYKSCKLFYDTEHPCNNVIKEICKGVFELLDIDCRSIKEVDANLGEYEEAVYPCVMEALGLAWDEKNIRENKFKLQQKMDFDEYYKEYLYWCYEI